MRTILSKKALIKNFSSITFILFPLLALLHISFWWLEITFKWLPILLIAASDLYILAALFVAAKNSDAEEQRKSAEQPIDQDQTKTFISDGFLPTRVGGLLIFISIFLIVLFGYASIYNGRVDSSFSGKVDQLYFSLTTLATVGYGDFAPRTEVAKILVMSEMLSGLILLVGGLGFLVSRLSLF